MGGNQSVMSPAGGAQPSGADGKKPSKLGGLFGRLFKRKPKPATAPAAPNPPPQQFSPGTMQQQNQVLFKNYIAVYCRCS